MRDRLKQASARFRFLIQLRKDADQMPLDRATVPWSEELSPPIHVADLVLHMQDVTARGQPQYGENLALNIWRVTKDHEPVGSLADARRAVYAASAEQRRNVNGIPIGEPDEPRPILTPLPAVDSIIVRAAIHPAIGIARIGDSKTEYFIGPELVEAPVDPTSVDPFRDSTGAIKRQAARFRVYGYNAAGGVVRELTSENAAINWTAHVANRKAQWYQFQYALDIPEAVNAPDNKFPLRNPGVRNRSTLAIDPGPRSISGSNRAGGPEYAFDTGTFQARATKPVTVPLGEIRTDEMGRLIFLGGGEIRHRRQMHPSMRTVTLRASTTPTTGMTIHRTNRLPQRFPLRGVLYRREVASLRGPESGNSPGDSGPAQAKFPHFGCVSPLISETAASTGA
ncbi:LodA/GoxA family CTQ-dependent oxidase [Sinorhizobium meliloti]|uniref:LodA/GoxA family CTQ-dependent oxidase n=1 Tax=Rhizobium meliloti TaxID=382 RepID=UPI003D65B61D